MRMMNIIIAMHILFSVLNRQCQWWPTFSYLPWIHWCDYESM